MIDEIIFNYLSMLQNTTRSNLFFASIMDVKKKDLPQNELMDYQIITQYPFPFYCKMQ